MLSAHEEESTYTEGVQASPLTSRQGEAELS